jgi:hypothetical protein
MIKPAEKDSRRCRYYELIIPHQNTKYHAEQLVIVIIYNLEVIPAVCHPRNYIPLFVQSGGRILGRNPDKSLKVFLVAIHRSPLQLCLEISISSNSHKLLQFSYCTRIRVHSETSSLRTLQILPRNLSEIVRVSIGPFLIFASIPYHISLKKIFPHKNFLHILKETRKHRRIAL